MNTIAVINRKGGVGKTTTALCMADAFSAEGKKTLLVDLDQQHNSSKQYHAKITDQTTVFDLLTDTNADIQDAVQHTETGDIIAGDDLINRAESEMSNLAGRDFMLADALAKLNNTYDFIIIDCSPVLGIVSTNALIAADEVVVPMLCDGYSIDAFTALNDLIKQIQSNQRLNPNLKIAGMLLTMYQANQRLVKAYDSELPAFAKSCNTRVFNTKIRSCCKVKESQQKAKSLFTYAPNCTTAQDYIAFIKEYLKVCA